MKVTVCFGSTRIVVPCGDRNYKVGDLISKAVIRYKKATEKPNDVAVIVHNLLQLDGGILDQDDILRDVVDDREQLIAFYDELGSSPHQGDGMSSSERSRSNSPHFYKKLDQATTVNGIEITGEELQGTPPLLHVRRGSEPALNRLSPIGPCATLPPDPCKRWSAAPVISDEMPSSSTPKKIKSGHITKLEKFTTEEDPGEREEGSGEEKGGSSSSPQPVSSVPFKSTFSREANRCSIQILSDNFNSNRWLDAADRAVEGSSACNWPASSSKIFRQDPLGGSCTPTPSIRKTSETSQCSLLVCLVNDGSPLGIHVIPSTDSSGVDQGLLVEGIEHDGRVARDGRINVHDVIIEINGHSLRGVTFHQAQEIFKNSMSDSELRLLIIKNGANVEKEEEEFFLGGRSRSLHCERSSKSSTLSSRAQTAMQQSNTRRIGQRICVKLRKGVHGLGFSITTRDNPASGEAPIYIKNILPKGAAIDEGTLRIGDRLLEVNGVVISGQSQSEVANLLRQIPVGDVVSIIISRQNKFSENSKGTKEEAARLLGENRSKSVSPKLPRHLPFEKVPEDNLVLPWKQRTIMTLDIPVHDSERAGLGVSVKGKTSSGPNGNIDLGIFVKNVIHGGAASRDGRLRQNDQLVNINGLSLLGRSNSEAMKTLRKAMHHEGSTPGKITLTVARRMDGRHRSASIHDNSDISVSSERTTNLTFKKGDAFDDDSVERLDFNCNPVIQRLTGADSKNLRNESYYKATHDTWNSSSHFNPSRIDHSGQTPLPQGFASKAKCPSADAFLMHDESSSSVEKTSIDESCTGFSRDQFGRQSMSEKRHATLDAKNTGTYQRSKKAREEREKQKREVEHKTLAKGGTANKQKKDVGPRLGMRKSSSLESLQTMVQEVSLEESARRGASPGRASSRGRVCNDSFRAAVDRSYDATTAVDVGQMETVAEEESESGLSAFGRGTSCQSSLTPSVEGKGKIPTKTRKKKIFKGLGSMFKFSKNRKSLDSATMTLAEEASYPERHSSQGNPIGNYFPDDQRGTSAMHMEGFHMPSSNENMMATFPCDERMYRSERMHKLRAEHQRKHAERNGLYPTDGLERNHSPPKHRFETMPVDPKAEIQHYRSRSHDLHYSNRKGVAPRSRGGGGGGGGRSDPNKFSHYANYEQIQILMNKYQEQERLAKLASQQYQDFREKQTRRNLNESSDSNFLSRLEQKFIHESIASNREQREYQSQRTTRDSLPPQRRPASNYFEYETVQSSSTRGSERPPEPHPSAFSLPRRSHAQAAQRRYERGADRQVAKLPLQNVPLVQTSHPNAKTGNNNILGSKYFGDKRFYSSQPRYWYGPDQSLSSGVPTQSSLRQSKRPSGPHDYHNAFAIPGSKV